VIDFRYHVVSIVAVFLALALGLFLGSTSLQNTVVDSIKGKTESVAKENKALVQQLDQSNTQLADERTFDAAIEPYAVSGRLSGQLVVVISAPGVPDSVRKPMLTALDQAGATVTADVRLQSQLVDPKQDSFLTALTDRVEIPGHTIPVGTGAERAAAQLADVLGVRPQTKPVSAATANTVLSAYSTGGLLSVQGTVARAGTLALVIAGPAPGLKTDPQLVTAQQTMMLDLALDLDASAVGAVIAGPTAVLGTAPGVVAAANKDSRLTPVVSTVDGVEAASGRIDTVFALAAQVDGVTGKFGLHHSPPIPPRSPGP
jgi:hypothetical protein